MLKEYLDAEKKKIFENCTPYSQCVEVCPNAQAFSLDKGQVKLLSNPVFQWIFGCNHCGPCRAVCPQGLNPLLFNYILNREISLRGDKRVSIIRNYLRSPTSSFTRTIEMMQHLFFKSSEIQWLTQVPKKSEPVELVLLIGCTGTFRPDITLSLLDTMDMIGINYVALGGSHFCCGGPFQLIGEMDEFERYLRNLFKNLAALKPDLVLYACAQRLYNATHIAPHIIEIPFKQESALKFVADNIRQLSFKEPHAVKVSFHDSCSLGRLCGDYQSPRTIINYRMWKMCWKYSSRILHQVPIQKTSIVQWYHNCPALNPQGNRT